VESRERERVASWPPPVLQAVPAPTLHWWCPAEHHFVGSVPLRLVWAHPVGVEEGWQVDIPIVLPAIHELGNHCLECPVELLKLLVSLGMVGYCILPFDPPLP